MSRNVFVFVVAACLLVSALITKAQAAPARVELSPTVARIVELVNIQRANAGLRPLAVNPILLAEAQRFSGVQADMGRLSHRGNDGSTAGQRLQRAGYNWRFYGENLAAGQPTAEEVVQAWMNSPAHRANVLASKARELGVGHTHRAGDPSYFFDYYVLEVAAPR